jgi:hypothetical protein
MSFALKNFELARMALSLIVEFFLILSSRLIIFP